MHSKDNSTQGLIDIQLPNLQMFSVRNQSPKEDSHEKEQNEEEEEVKQEPKLETNTKNYDTLTSYDEYQYNQTP